MTLVYVVEKGCCGVTTPMPALGFAWLELPCQCQGIEHLGFPITLSDVVQKGKVEVWDLKPLSVKSDFNYTENTGNIASDRPWVP